MSSTSPSPFAKPVSGLRIKEGAPPVRRPTKEEIASFPKEALNLLQTHKDEQLPLIGSGKYKISPLKGKHFLLAGATGPGLGGAFASAVIDLVKENGSITMLSRDLKKSLGFETGKAIEAQAIEAGMGDRFHWMNDGMALEGEKLGNIVSKLKEAGANKVIYINTVASASSGLLPGLPPVYVKDADEEGLFQWQLTPLDERAIEATQMIMGTMAVEFPKVLDESGIEVEATVFADWRGSIDRMSRNPENREYGRQGAYSTSLFLPKDTLQEATSLAYGTDKLVIDAFLPVMRTRALGFIPGGNTMSEVYKKLMEKSGVQLIGVPELALGVLDYLNLALNEGADNPFPRFDMHEAAFELWFYEVVERLNDSENSDFYYKRWID